MSPVPVRSLARVSPPPVNHAARLELLEYFLVHHEDIARCGQAGLDWLMRYTPIRRAVCLAVDGETSSLVGLAGIGVSPDEVSLSTAACRLLDRSAMKRGTTIAMPSA